MPRTLKYTVLNSTVFDHVENTTVDGDPATVTRKQALVECEPADHSGGTLKLILPALAADEYPAGAALSVTITVEGA